MSGARPFPLWPSVAMLLIAVCIPCAIATAADAGLNQGIAGIAPDSLFPGAEFDTSLPTQAAFTGVAPGERPLRPEEVVAYLSALADASPQARLIEFARTHEGRPLVVLAVSDATTIADLDGFKSRHVAVLDPRRDGVATPSELAETKAVAWLAYGIHGDELSSTDAAVSLAYWLVSGTDASARQLRDELLILIDPNENPDGRARYLAQIASFAHRAANPDQDDLSHRGVWPWGRGNHYLFDMNRDWFTMIHPESARSREIASWLPQLMVDSHEMGANATYLFPPARHPFNPHLPANTVKWEQPFSDDQARALDRRGYPYYSGEWNEEFFPGYGSSWAAYHGAVGILYEMSRTTGTQVIKRDGTERSFAQAIEHQVASSVANLSTLRAQRAQVLSDHIAARAEAVESGRRGPVAAWFLLPEFRHPERLPALARLLNEQGIEVHELTEAAIKVKGLVDARTGVQVGSGLSVGTLMVRLDQPAGNLARVLLDPHVPMNATFFQDEREYLEKGKGSRLYETTAWSLPLVRGVPAIWGRSVPKGSWRRWTAPPKVSTPILPAAPWTSLVIDGDPASSLPLLAELLQQDVKVRVARKAFTISGRVFHAGALVIRREGNVDNLEAVLDGLKNRRTMYPVTTSRATAGPDLGGSEFDLLVAPKVAVLAGMPVSPTVYGAVWHLLDQELDLRFSSLDAGRFARVDLSRYNVLILPPVMGGTGMYRQVIGTGGLDRLRRWIEAGGTAIGLGGGAQLLADAEVGLVASRFRGQALAEFPPPVWSLGAEEAEAAGRASATGLRPPAPPSGEDGSRGDSAPPTARISPYDVAPILGAGARPFVAGHEQGTPLDGAPVRLADWLSPVLPVGRPAPEEPDLERADGRLRSFMPQGVLLRAELDPELWLDYGLDERITVWFGSDDSIVARPPAAVAAAFPVIDELHLGGLLWPEAAARLARTGYAVREQVGRGQVILFAENPVFRRWMVESERMLINAVLLGPGLGTNWSSPW